MKRALLLLLAAAAVFAVFSPLLRAPFLFDDHTVIEGDEAIVAAQTAEDGDGRDVDLWQDLWRKPRPLRQLTHRVEWRLFGDAPGAGHAVNLLLHLAVAATGWWLLRRRCGVPDATAALAAAFFLFNPVVVESLAIVSHRKEMLSALFLLLSLGAALGAPGRFSPAAAACLLLAAAGKETALVAPALFALLAFRAPEPATDGGRGSLRSANRAWLRPFALYCAVAALGAALFWWQIHEGMDFAGGNPGDAEARAGHFTAGVAWGEAVSAALRAFPRNLLLLALPFGHVPDPPIALHVPLLSAETLAAALAIAVCAAILAVLGSRRDAALRPALWILFALGPYLFPGLLRIGATAVLADRYLYLASFGFAWLLADLAARLPRRWAAAAATALLAVFAVSSFRLCRPCRDESDYWAFAARENPDSVLAAHNHAWGLWKEQEDFRGARKEFGRMLRMAPNFDYGVCSFAQMHAEENDPESAFELLDAALRKRPDSMFLHRQRALIGVLYDEDDSRSLGHFRKAARLGAKDAAFHRGHAELLRRILEWPEAKKEFDLAAESPAFAEDARDARLLLRDPPRRPGGGVLVVGDSVPHGTGTGPDGGSLLSLAAALDALCAGSGLPPTVDASVPGSSVRDLDRQISRAVEAAAKSNAVPAVCAILTGHNDAFAGVPSFEILQALAEAALECRRKGIVPVLVGPIHVRDEPGRPRRRQEKTLAALDRKLASFCEKANLSRVSSRDALGPNDPALPSGGNYDPATGNHLSRKGMEALSSAVLRAAFP